MRYHICHRQVREVMALLNDGRTWCWEEDILKDRSVDSRSACEAKDLEATVRRLMKEFGRREGASLAEIRVTGLPKPLYFQVGEKGHAYLLSRAYISMAIPRNTRTMDTCVSISIPRRISS